MAKRSAEDAHPPAKRPRAATNQEESKSNTSTPTQDDVPYERLQLVPFPEEIQALPHVLKSINALAMTVVEALVEATRTHQVEWVEQLLDKFACDLPEIMVQASGEGHCDIVELLLHKVLDVDEELDEEAEIDDDTQTFVRKVVVVAAENGHLEIVKLVLPLVMDFDRFSYRSKWFTTARNAVDAAAANGYLKVVKFMMQHARKNHYEGRYSIWPVVDTLSLAIEGEHVDVAEYLIKNSGVLWNLETAFVRALEKGQVNVLDTIYDTYTRVSRGQNLFMDLAYSGHLDAVKYLYNHKCNDGGLVGKAFARAAHYGR